MWKEIEVLTSEKVTLNVEGTLLDHCLKSLHNTVKHMNLPTVV